MDDMEMVKDLTENHKLFRVFSGPNFWSKIINSTGLPWLCFPFYLICFFLSSLIKVVSCLYRSFARSDIASHFLSNVMPSVFQNEAILFVAYKFSVGYRFCLFKIWACLLQLIDPVFARVSSCRSRTLPSLSLYISLIFKNVFQVIDNWFFETESFNG
jgi:hypothetical protein